MLEQQVRKQNKKTEKYNSKTKDVVANSEMQHQNQKHNCKHHNYSTTAAVSLNLL